ncbi:hypothetical protein ACV35C_30650, partial [Pseudomonas aeruginosa]
QRQALAERKGGDAEDGRPSLLQRLFGGKESETAAEPSASVPSVVAASNTPIQPAAAAPSLPVAEHDEAPGGPPPVGSVYCRHNGRHRCARLRGGFRLLAAEQALQQARATVFGIAALALGQRLALQPAQRAEQ